MTADETAGTFVCPECLGTIPVSASEKQALVRHGCAVCGATIPATAFSS